MHKVSRLPGQGKKVGGKGIKSGKGEGEGSDEGSGSGSFGTEDMEMEEERVPVTPVRKGPAKKSRAKKFEGDTEVEEDEFVREWEELEDSV